jgi:hypothetical protein
MKPTKVLRDIEVELESGKKVSHQFVYECYLDGDYGADIDGNRGVPVLFVELNGPSPQFTRDLQLKDSNDNPLSDEETEEAIDLLWTSADHEIQTIELEDDYDPEDFY